MGKSVKKVRVWVMTVQERIDDIAENSGYSKDVVRAVLSASMTSLVKSLRIGERATLPGICTFNPSISGKLTVGDKGTAAISSLISIKVGASKSLITKLEDLDCFEHGIDTQLYQIPNVATHQIEGLL